MSINCTIATPLVKGKPSKLYDGLLKKLGKNNKKLVNLIYSTVTTESFKKQMDSSKFDKLGEPKLTDLEKVLDFDAFTTNSDSMEEALRYVGAINSYGKRVEYTDLESTGVLDRIIEFNKKNKFLRARYQFNDGKYYITIEPITSSNYNTNAKIEKASAKYNAAIELLNSVGLNTNWSDESKIYRNRTNGHNLVRDLENMANATTKKPYVIYPTQGNFIRDLFKNNSEFMGHINAMYNLIEEKIRDKYPNDEESLHKRVNSLINTLLFAATGDVNTLSKADREFIQDIEANNQDIAIHAEDAYLTIFDPATGDFYNKMGKNNFKYAEEFNQKIEEIESKDWNEGQFLGVEDTEISETLRVLNDKFHIDADVISDMNESIKTISNLANRFKQKLVKDLELYKNSYNKIIDRDQIFYDVDEDTLQNETGAEKKDLEFKVRSITNAIRRQSYAQSIASCLDNIINEFESIKKEALRQKTEDDLDDVGKYIRTNARELNKLKQLISAYKSTVVQCMDIDKLINDQYQLPEELIPYIKDVATKLNSAFDTATKDLKEKQFALVYLFLKTYGRWGENDTKVDLNGEMVSLEDLLKAAQKDVNFFDRFVYSLNESNDTVLGLIHQTVRNAHINRDRQFREVDYILRTALEDLGKGTDFMFNRNSGGKATGYLLSDYNFEKYDEDLNNYIKKLRDEHKPQAYIEKAIATWKREHTQEVTLFGNKEFDKIYDDLVTDIYGKNHILHTAKVRNSYTVMVPYFENENKKNIYALDRISKLSEKERTYYYKMMALKHILSHEMPDSMRYKFFDAVQVSGDLVNRLENVKSVKDMLHIMGQSIKDMFVRNETDVDEYPDFNSVLEVNGISPIVTDHNGNIVKRVPILYTNRLQDMSRLSTNMNAAMSAFAATALNYNNLNAILEPLILTKDLIANDRGINERKGTKGLIDIFNYGGEIYANVAKKVQGTDSINATLDDFFERNVYGNKKKREDVVVFGRVLSLDKAADVMTGMTSSLGLTTNVLGAVSNLLVGKLQMAIEAGAGEFFNFKDWAVAELKYSQWLPEYLNETASNNKKSLMKLLGDAFDVEEDVFRKIAEKGYNKNALKRIFHNKNLTIMYGGGEHILHYTGMLSVLHHIKVFDKQKQVSVPILDIFQVARKDGSNNGKLYIDYDRYEFIEKDGKKRKLTEDDIFGKEVRGRIAYTNKTLHGNFSDIDKGNLHRWAVGRMLINFRQWMPAHYQRRFRGNHYDADLGEFRRGYYVSMAKFVSDVVSSWVHAKPGLATSWAELSEADKYNVKRAISEAVVMVILMAQIGSMGTYKDHKGNWAARMYLYQLNRLMMETKASSLWSGTGIVDNLISLLNSPMACLSTIDMMKNLTNLSYINETVKSGPHKGENKFYYTWETKAPYLSKIRAARYIAEEDAIFNLFKSN